jgi:hypothetical protein
MRKRRSPVTSPISEMHSVRRGRCHSHALTEQLTTLYEASSLSPQAGHIHTHGKLHKTDNRVRQIESDKHGLMFLQSSCEEVCNFRRVSICPIRPQCAAQVQRSLNIRRKYQTNVPSSALRAIHIHSLVEGEDVAYATCLIPKPILYLPSALNSHCAVTNQLEARHYLRLPSRLLQPSV